MLFEMYFASFFYALLKLLSVSKTGGGSNFSLVALSVQVFFLLHFFSSVNFSVLLVDVHTVFSSAGLPKSGGAEESHGIVGPFAPSL